MDPKIHTIAYLRSHSALLLTGILAASAHTVQMTDNEKVSAALYLHAERLFHIAFSSTAQSPELVVVSPKPTV